MAPNPSEYRFMTTKKDPYAALRYSDFRFFVITKILLTMALQFQAVIVGWHVYSITKDPLSLGLIGLVEILPNFAVTLFAGHFADIYDRKKIVFSCLSVLIFSGLALYYTAHHIEDHKVMYIYIIIGITGLARGVLAPSLFSILTECVPKEFYVNSTSWHSTLWQIAFMLGAGASGFLFAALSYDVYWIISLLTALATVAFFFISPKKMRKPLFLSQSKVGSHTCLTIRFFWVLSRLIYSPSYSVEPWPYFRSMPPTF